MKQYVIDLSDGGVMEIDAESEKNARSQAKEMLLAFFDPSVYITNVRTVMRKHRKKTA